MKLSNRTINYDRLSANLNKVYARTPFDRQEGKTFTLKFIMFCQALLGPDNTNTLYITGSTHAAQFMTRELITFFLPDVDASVMRGNSDVLTQRHQRFSQRSFQWVVDHGESLQQGRRFDLVLFDIDDLTLHNWENLRRQEFYHTMSMIMNNSAEMIGIQQ